METYEDYLKRQLAAKETDDTISLEGVTVPKICGSMKPFKFTGTTKGYELTLTPVLKSQVRMSDITPILRVVVARMKNDYKSIKTVRGTIVVSYNTKFKKSQATDNFVSSVETKYAELVARAIRDINHVVNGASLGTSSPRVFRTTTPKPTKQQLTLQYIHLGITFSEADIPKTPTQFRPEIMSINGSATWVKLTPKTPVSDNYLDMVVRLLARNTGKLLFQKGKGCLTALFNGETMRSSILTSIAKEANSAASQVYHVANSVIKAGPDKTLSPDKKKLTSVSMLKKYKETGELPPMTKENFETILKSLLRKSK